MRFLYGMTDMCQYEYSYANRRPLNAATYFNVMTS